MREDHPTVTGEKMASSKGNAFSSIQGRLVSLLLLVLVPILLAQAYFNYGRYQSKKSVESEANLHLARVTAKSFDTFVQDVLHREMAIGLAFTSSQTLSDKEKSRILVENQAGNPAIWHLFWDNPEGIVTAATGSQFIGMDLSDHESYREIVAGKDWMVSDLLLSRTTQQPSFTISRGIRNERGELLGIIVAGILPAELDRVLAIERLGDTGVSLLDSKGMHAYRYPATQYTWEQRNWLKLYPIIGEVLKGKEVVTNIVSDRTGINRIAAFTPVPSIGWVATCSRAEEEVVGPITSATLQETGLTLLVAFVSLLTAVALSRTISSSVIILRNYALSLGQGEAHNRLTISKPVEIKDLAEAFNKMAEDIRSREKAVRESEEQFRVLIQNLQSAVALINERGAFTIVNRAFFRIFELNDDSSIRNVNDCDWSQWQVFDEHGVLLDVDKHPVRTAILTRKPVRDQLVAVKSPANPKTKWLLVSAEPILDSQGHIYRQICTYHDITEYKRAEEAQRESQERLALAADAGQVGMFDLNMATGDLQWARQHEIIFGYESTTTTTRTYRDWADRVHPEDLPMVEECMRQAMKELFPFQVEYRLVWPDNSLHWVNVTSKYYFDDSGRCTRLMGAARDITKQKLAEEALKERENQFRALADSIPNLAWWANGDGYITWYNRRWYEYTGTTPEQMEGWGWQSVHDPNELPLVLERWQVSIVTGEPFDMTFPLLGADGIFRPFLTRVIPLKDAAGRVQQWFGTNTDVSEMKRVEQALRESEERHRLLSDTMLQGVVHQDANGKIISTNPAAERILGKSREQFMGCNSVQEEYDCIREDGEIFPGQEHPVMESLRTGLPIRNVTMGVFNPKLDQYRWINIDAVPVFHADELHPAEVYAVFDDITDRKRAEEKIKAALAEKEVMLKEIHHRVKNNLQVISSLVSMQANNLTDEKTREEFDDICGRIRSMALIHEILYQNDDDMARLNFADYAANLLQSLWNSHDVLAEKVKLNLAFVPVTLTIETAVPCGLILNELAGNTLKHAFPNSSNGEVTVGLELDAVANKVCLWVRDNGVGLSPDMDWRQTNSLGLRLVQILTGQLRGIVETGTGPGAEFRVTFPLNGMQT